MKTEKYKIAELLNNVELGHGLGTDQSPCSIAAINLAINGKLTDDIPECMSLALGKWIIKIQDRLPLDQLNGKWKALLPSCAGTGRKHEEEITQILLDYMWETSLPSIQYIADQKGFGEKWALMCKNKDKKSADAAADAADAAAAYAAAAAADAAAYAAAYAAAAAADAAYAAYAAYAADAAAAAAADAAAYAAYAYAYAADDAAYWEKCNPEQVLENAIALTQ